MRGFWLKQGKENSVGGRGTPLIIKSNLKCNIGLIWVFEIYSINYCFLVLSKTGILFYSHDVLVEVTSYDEATYCCFQQRQETKRPYFWKACSGTLTRPNSQLEIMSKFPYHALARLNSHYLAQTRPISPLLSQCNFTITPQRTARYSQTPL